MPLGVEIQASAYAYTCKDIADSNKVLNYTTFYNFKLINRSLNDYKKCSIGLWEETDLGNYMDDYIGCHVSKNFAYTYNGDNYDEDNSGNTGYHSNLPMLSCQLLNGPPAAPNDGIDNNNNGTIDENGEINLMNSLTSYSSSNTSPNNNGAGIQYYNYATGLNNLGTAFTYGGNGLGTGTVPTKFLYPGKTTGASDWTEITAGNNPGERNLIIGCGPFNLNAGAETAIDFAIIFTQDSALGYNNNLGVYPRMVKDNDLIKKWFDGQNAPGCLDLSTIGVSEPESHLRSIILYPNPASQSLYIEYEENLRNVTLEIYDMLGNTIKQYETSHENKSSIPVADLSPGIYLLKIRKDGISRGFKFVKE